MRRQLMVVPSLACPASCTYCFGPNRGPTIPLEVLGSTLGWIDATTSPNQIIDLTFHGGEPLAPGLGWYREALPALRRRFGDRARLHMQSNLWGLSDEWCELLKDFRISLSTSLDGPERINDRQRGVGYFTRTMAGVETARRNGLGVGVICTFTRLSAPSFRETCEFFADQDLDFCVHPAVPGLNRLDPKGLCLTPAEHGDLMVQLLDHYLANATRIRISTLDAMASGISRGGADLCTFGDCLGGYLTVDPDGDIYSCNRFIGQERYRLGSVLNGAGLEELERSAAWKTLREREERIEKECAGCGHFDYCRGGCPYNAFAAGSAGRDPHCPAYKKTFDHITELALEQVFSPDNIDAVVENGSNGDGLLRKGGLLQIMRGGPHPKRVKQGACRTAAAVALAACEDVRDALERLERAGVATDPDAAVRDLTRVRSQLRRQPQGLVNAYIHVTYACNLRCGHCYASSDTASSWQPMAVTDVLGLVRQASMAGFSKAVITGGEPLAHPQRDSLLDALTNAREEVKPLRTVLRTNLAYTLTSDLTKRLAHCTDEIVVSVDGGQESHDQRRGAGSHARTVANLRDLSALGPTARLSITAVLAGDRIAGPDGEAVRELAAEFGVQARFKPLLPIGRAAGLSLRPEYYSSVGDREGSEELVAFGSRTSATCGLGMNLYVGPGGECFPCHALMGPHHTLGNALQQGLTAVLGSRRYTDLKQTGVDTNRRCSLCTLRYLCGGFCRAFGGVADVDAPLEDCSELHRRALRQLESALDCLDVSAGGWLAAGLPIPDQPPRVGA